MKFRDEITWVKYKQKAHIVQKGKKEAYEAEIALARYKVLLLQTVNLAWLLTRKQASGWDARIIFTMAHLMDGSPTKHH